MIPIQNQSQFASIHPFVAPSPDDASKGEAHVQQQVEPITKPDKNQCDPNVSDVLQYMTKLCSSDEKQETTNTHLVFDGLRNLPLLTMWTKIYLPHYNIIATKTHSRETKND